jgi:tetratricopeptide (TPR) repeat protein
VTDNRGLFVGVGVSAYTDQGLPALPHPRQDVVEVRAAIDNETYVGTPLLDPPEQEVRALLRSAKNSLADGGSLLAIWSGHGHPAPANGGVRLLASDSDADETSGLSPADIVGPCALSGASQILLIVDACYSGQALSAYSVASALVAARPPEAQHVWVGVLASTSDASTARDGVFGRALLDLLQRGPQNPDLVRRWSVHNERIRGDDLCDALLKEWNAAEDQQPQFLSTGSAWYMLPNPLYEPDAPAQVVEHLLRAARGSQPDERSWFTGRTVEVNRVVSWVTDRRPGVYVVTGSAGTGKSAIVGRVVSVSVTSERERLAAETPAWGHGDPGVESIAAHAHARGVTDRRLAQLLDSQLVQSAVIPWADSGLRNANELLGAIERAAQRDDWSAPVIVVDGLDEASVAAVPIASEFLTRLSSWATVIVATRDLANPDPTKPSLLAVLTPTEILDLDDPAIAERGREAIYDYITLRLAGRSEAMDPAAVATYFLSQTNAVQGEPFLLARLMTDEVRLDPLDTGADDWRHRVSTSVRHAFLADVKAIDPSGPTADAAGAAETLLTALTWAFGAGFPEEEWLSTARAIDSGGHTFTRDDLSWVLNWLGRYVVQDGESGAAVYRLAHQSLADQLADFLTPSLDRPFDPRATGVAQAMLDRYATLLAAGRDPREPGYLWRYAWRHTAEGGFAALSRLREMAEKEPMLTRDVALAAGRISDVLASVGNADEAVAPAEEAVQAYGSLGPEDPEAELEVANALVRLGSRYAAVARRTDAVEMTENGVAIYRRCAEANPAYLPDLAGALQELGIRYAEIGRPSDSITAAAEATALYRRLSMDNSAFGPELASALNNLGAHFGEAGRPDEAIAPAEEAVEWYQRLAADNPAFEPELAGALNNLGTYYTDIGRVGEAIQVTESAIHMRRGQAAENRAHLPDLALALDNLGSHYAAAGRLADAVVSAEEAVALRRSQAERDGLPGPELARTLSNLGGHYANDGDPAGAFDVLEEAAGLYRRALSDDPAQGPNLARTLALLAQRYAESGRVPDAVATAEEALDLRRDMRGDSGQRAHVARLLDDLGSYYAEAGRLADAIVAAEEAVWLFRQLSADAGHRPDLARTLTNLANIYGESGRSEDAVTAAEEAVGLRRTQAAENAEREPDLALALGNLGVHYSYAGRLDESVTAAEEAVTLRRRQAERDRRYAPDLARALDNVGSHYANVGRIADAIGAATEAVGLRRAQVAETGDGAVDLATALNNLAGELAAADRFDEAVAAALESVRIYVDRVPGHPEPVPAMTAALTALDRAAGSARSAETAEQAWQLALGAVSVPATAVLLSRRAELAVAGRPEALGWIRAGLAAAADTGTVAVLRREARRHRGGDPAAFDAGWAEQVGTPIPDWLTVDPALLETANGWVETVSYQAEADWLADHPALLDPAADIAVEEALLRVPTVVAERYRSTRAGAGADGVRAAYEPLIAADLAARFVVADTAERRSLLEQRGDELRGAAVGQALVELTGKEQYDRAITQAQSLIALSYGELLSDALSALDRSELMPDFLAEAAGRDPASLQAAALLAMSVAQDDAESARGWLYIALAAEITGDTPGRDEAIGNVRALDLAHVSRWAGHLGLLAVRQPAAATLIEPLLNPPAGEES